MTMNMQLPFLKKLDAHTEQSDTMSSILRIKPMLLNKLLTLCTHVTFESQMGHAF